MSVAEMKLAAINQISVMEDESAVMEILEHLAKLNNLVKEKSPFMRHAEEIMKERDSVLEKLAQ